MSKQISLGYSYHWWRGDNLPQLPPLPGFAARIVDDQRLLADLHGLAEGEMQARFDEGAHCYVAFLNDEPVGYGWVGSRIGHIREAGLEWALGEQDRALWDFATLPAFRAGAFIPIYCRRYCERNQRMPNVSGSDIKVKTLPRNGALKRPVLRCITE